MFVALQTSDMIVMENAGALFVKQEPYTGCTWLYFSA